jgi:hypothetical protein
MAASRAAAVLIVDLLRFGIADRADGTALQLVNLLRCGR